MESEKVKEIKEKLQEEIFIANSFGDKLRKVPTKELENLLTLINELESENKELKRYKLDWLNSEKMHLQADMEDTEFELFCANKSLEEVRAENKQLKDRIAELEKKNAKLLDSVETVQSNRCVYKCVLTKEHLTKFAERLKEKFVRQEERFAIDVTRFEKDLDKVKESDLPTAKFLIGKATGQATMAEKAEYYIDETLKEFIDE